MKTFNIQIKKTANSKPEWLEVLAVNEQSARAKVNNSYTIIQAKEEKLEYSH